uniref:Protein phosphatase 1 regulatory subunit 14 n=1 Tax=Monodelphis domestica TaxID=13616 RepID=F6SCU8_MONDO
MPDEVNIDELLELESEEERSKKIQSFLLLPPPSLPPFIQDFARELLLKLRGLHKQPGVPRGSPSDDSDGGGMSPVQDQARTAPR